MSGRRAVGLFLKVAIPLGYLAFAIAALFGTTTHAQAVPSVSVTIPITPPPLTPTPTLTPTATSTASPTATTTVTPTVTFTPTPGPTVASTLTLKPAALHFPFQLVLPPNGVASTPRNAVLSVSKKQPSPVTLLSISVSDPNQFSIGANSCQTIAPGQSCNVPIVFTPRNLRLQKAVLTVASNAHNGALTMQLVGHGKQGKLTIAPRSLAFGAIAVNSTSAPKTVTLTNNNPIDMTLSGFTTSNQAVFPFQAEQNTCGSTLAAGASCTLQVVFNPQQAGSFRGSFFVNDNAFKSPQQIRLSGSGRGASSASSAESEAATPSPTGAASPGTLPMRAFPSIH